MPLTAYIYTNNICTFIVVINNFNFCQETVELSLHERDRGGRGCQEVESVQFKKTMIVVEKIGFNIIT